MAPHLSSVYRGEFMTQFSQDHQSLDAVRVAIVSSGWHRQIVASSVQAATEELLSQQVPAEQIAYFEVPGAFEIPLHAQRLARSGEFDAIIACGLVVDGGIYRHEFVATAVIDGLMRVQLDTDVPVFSAVLTPHHFHEHDEHIRYFTEHFKVKGKEVAQACAATLRSLARLPSAESRG